MNKDTHTQNALLKSFLFFSISFIFGYCLTIIFHEYGHALLNQMFGKTEFTLFYSPFGKSAVETRDDYSSLSITQQTLIYAMGPLFDIICSTLIAFPMWRTYKQKYLPFLMWNGLSFMGQGIGILMDVIDRDSPWGAQTDGGMILSLTGISPVFLFSISLLSVIIGCVLLSLILPLVGVSKTDSILKISLIFLPGMVFYFSLTTIYASIFDENRLGERKGQLISATLLTIFLTVIYKPLYRIYYKLYPVETQLVKKQNFIAAFSLMSGIMLFMWLISESSFALISASIFCITLLAIIVVWKLGAE
ncbi:hypothetical protein [Candidatus Lokiarchaeum ossiferum]|uniref:hypothetical protein n=1 Tax=Candidatus Lokiarchaeum ossiferum TaxID=2951803 RepID=UPI00352C43FF